MSEWLLTQLFFLLNAVGAFCFLFLLGYSCAAIWGAIRQEYFAYRETMPRNWYSHLFVWLISVFSTATNIQSPDEFEENWSLRQFNFDDFLDAMDASIIIHGLMAVIVFARLRYNSPKKE